MNYGSMTKLPSILRSFALLSKLCWRSLILIPREWNRKNNDDDPLGVKQREQPRCKPFGGSMNASSVLAAQVFTPILDIKRWQD